MIGISLVRISYASNEWLMSEALSLRDRVSLGFVIRIRDACAVSMFEDVMRDSASFGTALGLRFNVNVSHNLSP
jgi:hypothetical protein